MENEVKKSAGKVWLIPTIVAAVLLIGLVVFMVIMGKGTSALADGTVTLSEAVSPLQDGTAQLSDGVDQYTGGVDTMNEAMPTLQDGVKQYTEGVDELNKNMKALVSASKTLSDGAKQLKAGAAGGVKAVQTLNSTMKGALAGIKDSDKFASANSPEAAFGVALQMVTGLSDAEVAGLEAKVGSYKAKAMDTMSKNTAFEGANTAFQGLLKKEAEDNPATLGAGVAAANGDSTQIATAVLTYGSTELKAAFQDYADKGEALKKAAADLNEANAGISKQEIAYAYVGATMTNNTQMVELIKNAQLKNFDPAYIASVHSNATVVTTYVMATKGAINTTDESTLQYVDPNNEKTYTVLYVAKAVAKGASDLEAGVNNPNPKKGAVAAINALYSQGTSKLSENSDALRDGVKQLADGAKQLSDNSKALRDGAAQLKEAAPALIDGIGQLVDGAKKVNGFTPIH